MPHILIADDNRFSRRMLQKHVKDLGHTTIEAENGRAALEIIESQHVDVLMSDLLMPEMNGLELLHELKIRGIQLPTLVISADIQESTRDEVMNFEVVSFVNKPFSANDVAEALSKALHEAAS